MTHTDQAIDYPQDFMDDDAVIYAGPHAPLSKGSHVQSADGREWTVCYYFLDGFGVVEGIVDLAHVSDDDLPPPEAMLREPYRLADVPCVGAWVHLIDRVARKHITDNSGEVVAWSA